MSDIASSDLTITILKNRLVKGSPGALQRNLVRIAFGNATLTYPSGGVPIPTFPSFGMRREIEYLVTRSSVVIFLVPLLRLPVLLHSMTTRWMVLLILLQLLLANLVMALFHLAWAILPLLVLSISVT
jgi:hypothetical protein